MNPLTPFAAPFTIDRVEQVVGITGTNKERTRWTRTNFPGCALYVGGQARATRTQFEG